MAIRPYLPVERVQYQSPDGRVLLINPLTRRWTVTDEAGTAILRECNGERTPRELAEDLVVPSGQRVAFDRAIKALINERVVSSSKAEYRQEEERPCGCGGPQSLHLEITNRCNLHCTHCYVSAGKQLHHELEFDEICSVIRDFRELPRNGEPGPVAITGGEARMRPDCIDVIRYCREQALDTVLFTDAVGLPEPFVAQLARHESWVQVSLDGPDAATNDPIRGKGTFEKIRSGIQLLLRYGFAPRMTLFVTLTRQSIDGALELLRYADGLGIGFIVFSQLNAQGRAKGSFHDIAPTTAQWIELGHRLVTERPKTTYVKGNVFGGLDMTSGTFPAMRCQVPSSPRIDCLGNVYPCQLFVGPESRIGNIREEALAAILNGYRVRALERQCAARSVQIERCASCTWRPLCYSGCPGHALSEFGTMQHEDSLCDVRLHWFESAARQILELGEPAPPARQRRERKIVPLTAV